MAKKGRSKARAPIKGAARRAASPLPEMIVRAEPAKRPPARDPVFWFGFEVAWAKLAAGRFVLFSLLALDALFQMSHAPRYGAGDFNVAQLPFLDAIAPGRVGFGVGQLLLGYGCVMIAFGVATRVLVPICALIYGWLYFGSQLDSYQHHYLVVLLLAIASFIPWQRPADSEPATPVRTWALRLLLVQLAIMYGWAAISKLDGAWLDGRTLALQMTGEVGKLITKTLGFKAASLLVIAGELTLALTIWARPGWLIAAPLGLAFHLGIVFTGLEIGLFAFLMLGIYVFVIPDRFLVDLVTPLERIAQRLRAPSWIAWAAGLVAAIVLAKLVRIENAFVVGLGVAIVPIVEAVRRRPPAAIVGVAQVLAIALWLLVDRASSVTVDYYRFWGGSQRRIGTPAEAEYAYRRLTEVAPDNEVGHYQLGRILIGRGQTADGVAHLREAQRLEPTKARAFVAEARFLQAQGKQAEALDKAKQATFADPSNSEARALLAALSGGKVDKADNTKPAEPDEPDEPGDPK